MTKSPIGSMGRRLNQIAALLRKAPLKVAQVERKERRKMPTARLSRASFSGKRRASCGLRPSGRWGRAAATL